MYDSLLSDIEIYRRYFVENACNNCLPSSLSPSPPFPFFYPHLLFVYRCALQSSSYSSIDINVLMYFHEFILSYTLTYRIRMFFIYLYL